MIIPVLDRISHDDSLFQSTFLDPAFFVEYLVFIIGFIEFCNVVSSSVAIKGPSVGIESPLFQMRFQLFDGLGRDKRPLASVVEFSVALRCQPGVSAYDKPGEIKVRQYLPFQRFQCQLLIGISPVDAESKGDAVTVHEQSHLHDGVWFVFF